MKNAGTDASRYTRPTAATLASVTTQRPPKTLRNDRAAYTAIAADTTTPTVVAAVREPVNLAASTSVSTGPPHERCAGISWQALYAAGDRPLRLVERLGWRNDAPFRPGIEDHLQQEGMGPHRLLDGIVPGSVYHGRRSDPCVDFQPHARRGRLPLAAVA